MAVTDKTDFWWNWKLVWGINEIYSDLINVDVTHVPYSWTHRPTSFFLKTRLGYVVEDDWYHRVQQDLLPELIVTDVKIIWEDSCTKQTWEVFIMAANPSYTKKYILTWSVTDWCWQWLDDREKTYDASGKCDCWKFFTTQFVKWPLKDNTLKPTWETWCETSAYPWIQINSYEYWRTYWLFSHIEVEWWCYEFDNIDIWDYLYVYDSTNEEDSWFAWQVRMITWIENWRLLLDSPWLWFKTPDTSNLADWEAREVWWNNVKYKVYKYWWEDIWWVADNKVYVASYWEWQNLQAEAVYKQNSQSKTRVISVAEANDKVFILTDNWYIHYSKSQWVHNKFFINEDMDAWWDKTSIYAYRDFILAFGRDHIAVWVPDEKNVYWTMYNQSTTIWTWSRYSYAEYDWDLIFVSNDKRLLSLVISNTVWRYMLDIKDVWDMLNNKLDTMIDTDEVFVGSDDNNLRVFVNTRDNPYSPDPEAYSDRWVYAKHNDWKNTMTHIYKFDKLFKVWSEDHIDWWCMQWVKEWIYYWEYWIYRRKLYSDWSWKKNSKNSSYKSLIRAYLIENENNKISVAGNWASAWAPDLFRVAKLNRLITTLWPGVYSSNTKTHITSYLEWIGVEYEFPIWTDDDTVNNKWVDLISKAYLWEEATIDECLLQVVEDSNSPYKVSCSSKDVRTNTLVPESPRCKSYKEFLIQDHWLCINDTLYKLAPTMPLVTSLGENQKYSTQIVLELSSEEGDILCFGWWMAELFIAPYWLKGSDWEYELSPVSSC